MKNYALLLLLSLFGFAQAQTVVYQEDFESGWDGIFPTGWSKSQGPNSYGWDVGRTNYLLSQNFAPPRAGVYACVNDEKRDNAAGTQNLAVRDRLISSDINLSSYAGQSVKLLLTFDYYTSAVPAGGTTKVGFFYVDYSADGGTTWRQIDSIPVPTSRAWRIRGVDVSRFKDSSFASTLKIAFRYFDQNVKAFGFAVDNVKIIEQPGIELAIQNSFAASNDKYSLANTAYAVPVSLTNSGKTDVTSLSFYYIVNGAAPVAFASVPVSVPAFNNTSLTSVAISGLNITFTTPGFKTVKVYHTAPNGSGVDVDHSNDTTTFTTYVLASRPVKNVVLEEFTGAWCQFCPDGAYRLGAIAQSGPNYFPAAIHQGDSMQVPVGLAIANTYNDGYPTMTADRKPFFVNGVSGATYLGTADRSLWAGNATSRQGDLVPIKVTLEAVYNAQTRQVDATIGYSSLVNETGPFRYNIYVLEDSVSGSGTGWDQQNYYNGVAGHPFQGKGNPIRGYQHLHVFRSSVGGAWGDDANEIAQITENGTGSKTYSFTLPARFKARNISLIGLLQRYNSVQDNQILNAARVELLPSTTAVDPAKADKFSFSIAPNPLVDAGQLLVNLPTQANVQIQVSNILGQELSAQSFGLMQAGHHTLTWLPQATNGQALPSGIYFVKMTAGGQSQTQRLVISR